jgi:hypothetical protein
MTRVLLRAKPKATTESDPYGMTTKVQATIGTAIATAIATATQGGLSGRIPGKSKGKRGRGIKHEEERGTSLLRVSADGLGR